MADSIISGGGPYMILPLAAASLWHGSNNEAAYQKICRGPDEGHIAHIGQHQVLVLGTPDPLFFLPLPNGGVCLRIVSGEDEGQKIMLTLSKNMPKKGWKLLGNMKITETELMAIDSALSGEDAKSNDSLTLNLQPGNYKIESLIFQPNDETEILLTRLIGAMKKKPAKITKQSKQKTKTPSPATIRYALMSAITTFGGGRGETVVKEENGVHKFFLREVLYATYRIEGNEQIVTIRKPKNNTDLQQKLKYYKEVADGWLEWRTPVSRDPRPWLEADIGRMTGSARYEIRGGPLQE